MGIPFPRPRPILPSWLLTGYVTSTREQFARLQAALDAAKDRD